MRGSAWKSFWRSVDLTGNQTVLILYLISYMFWRSVDLTGNQTARHTIRLQEPFWRSVDLTGNQTRTKKGTVMAGFGAVSI